MQASDALIAVLRLHIPLLAAEQLQAVAAALLAGERVDLDGHTLLLTADSALPWQATLLLDTLALPVALESPPLALPLDQLPPRAGAELAPQSYLPNRGLLRFAGRAAELLAIAHAVSANAAPAVVAGPAGMGKTCLALEFAHRYGRFFAGGVFWIDCASTPFIPTCIAQSGLAMGLYAQIDDLAAALALVQRAWSEPVPRLLIFDNCEDPTLLPSYLPAGGGCRALVLTRRSEWPWPVIPLGCLPRSESASLLQQLAPQLDAEAADLLAAEVADFPLALRLVGCYLRIYPASAAEYQAALAGQQAATDDQRSAPLTTDLPAHIAQQLQRVVAQSLSRLVGFDPVQILARQLLDVVCHMAPDAPIHDHLLLACVPETASLLNVRAARRLLIDLGLLEERLRGWATLHRLLQAILVASQATAAGYALIQQVSADLLDEVCAAGYVFVTPWLEPHAEAIVQFLWASETPELATSLHNLALLYHSQGRQAEAESRYTRALAIQMRVLDADHPDLARTLHNLARLYCIQARFAPATQLARSALHIRELMFGPDDPDTVSSVNLLARVHAAQQEYDPAAQLYWRVLAVVAAEQGELHLDTATVLCSLALCVASAGRAVEAGQLYRRALAIRRELLGDDDPETRQLLQQLAELDAQHH